MDESHLPKLPSTIFEVDEDKSIGGISQLNKNEEREMKEMQTKHEEERKRKPSKSEEGDAHETGSTHRTLKTPKGIERQLSKDENQSAIDNYYDKNQYSITGRYHKNEDTMQRIPKNFQKVLNGQRHANGEPSVGKMSTVSRRSQVVVPIPGANINRFVSSIYWIAQHNRKIGFRHFMMLIMMVLLTMTGGAVFYSIERPAEEADKVMKLEKLNETIKEIANNMREQMNVNKTAFTDSEQVKEVLMEAYAKLLNAEDRYKMSALYKKDSAKNMQWGYWEAVFFCTDIFMTVSYGAVPAITNLGRVIAILYAMFAIPMAIVVLRDLGQWILTVGTRCYARLLIRWRKARGIQMDDDEKIAFPVPVAIFMIGAAWAFGALFTYVYDRIMSPDGTGISYWGSVYLSYLTVTTIGLGDMLPMHVPRSPLWKYVHFLLMPIRVVNRCTYVTIEGTIFGLFTKTENKMIQLQIPKGGQHSQRVTPGLESSDSVIRNTHKPIDDPNANQMTTRSIASYLKEGSDVYGGDFGRVRINKAHIE